MPFINIYIHLIFSTKNREALITKDIKTPLLEHIRTNAKQKEIHVDFMNCVKDHIHLLVSLGAEQSVSKISQLIKGESSYWINKNKITKTKFEWQDEYIALSVSSSQINKVREYIKNQTEHHKIKSFTEEYNDLMEKIKQYSFKY